MQVLSFRHTKQSSKSYVVTMMSIRTQSVLKPTVSIGNRLPWLYINFFQSLWFRCIIIESGIFPSWVSRGVERGDSMFLKEGGMKKERGTDITNFALINQLTWKISQYDWNALFKKYCYFYSNNFKFCAVKKNYSRYIKKATRKIKKATGKLQ